MSLTLLLLLLLLLLLQLLFFLLLLFLLLLLLLVVCTYRVGMTGIATLRQPSSTTAPLWASIQLSVLWSPMGNHQ